MDTALNGANGLLHILHSIQKKSHISNVSSQEKQVMPDMIDIRTPKIIVLCSQIALISEKKVCFISQFTQ